MLKQIIGRDIKQLCNLNIKKIHLQYILNMHLPNNEKVSLLQGLQLMVLAFSGISA